MIWNSTLLTFLLVAFHFEANGQDVIWKRTPIIEQNLSRALQIEPENLCYEIDTLSCFETVHDFSLGNHDPIEKGQMEGLANPSQSTAISLDRVVLLACQNGLAKDHPMLKIKPNNRSILQKSECTRKA